MIGGYASGGYSFEDSPPTLTATTYKVGGGEVAGGDATFTSLTTDVCSVTNNVDNTAAVHFIDYGPCQVDVSVTKIDGSTGSAVGCHG